MRVKTQKIVPNLWFDDQAEDAVQFYTSLFEDSQIGPRTYYTKAGQEQHQRPPGSVMTIDFQLAGHKMVALNGGPYFKFNPSLSLFVICHTSQEADRLWKELADGAEVLMPLESYEWSPKYGWLQDRFGLSWQIMLEEPSTTQQKIIPLLFFSGKGHGNAEMAVKFYSSVFRGSSIEGMLHYGDENQYAKGAVMHSQFQLEGQIFMAMDSGVENDFPFNEAVSLIINCKDQQEIDYYWGKLTEGGDAAAQQCGWLKDKFGVSWQVVPEGMEEYFTDSDSNKVERAMEALMQMKKIELEKLNVAFHGEPMEQ